MCNLPALSLNTDHHDHVDHDVNEADDSDAENYRPSSDPENCRPSERRSKNNMSTLSDDLLIQDGLKRHIQEVVSCLPFKILFSTFIKNMLFFSPLYTLELPQPQL